jgi:hypothetical protein
MSWIDSRGRLFGLVNVIDALVLVAIAAAVPGGLLAYRSLRVSHPQVTAVTPAVMTLDQPPRVQLSGRNFRPSLQAYVVKAGTRFSVGESDRRATQAVYSYTSPAAAEVVGPDTSAGVYDLYLFDQGSQVAFLREAFQRGMRSAPRGQLAAVVRFYLPAETVPLLRVGDRDQVTPTPTAPDPEGATVTSVAVKPGATEVMEMHLLSTEQMWVGGRTPAQVVDVGVTIPVLSTPRGWLYKDEGVRAGEVFALTTPRYRLHGITLTVGDPPQAPAAK